MQDNNTTIAQLKEKAAQFVQERDWAQFHNPKNLSINISCEAAELMELFVWTPEQESAKLLETKRTDIEHEVADIFFSLLEFCNHTNIDLVAAFERKFELIKAKYPVDKAKSSSKKYTEL